jgi:glycosyltransferase involved in cell wall biosynthesis
VGYLIRRKGYHLITKALGELRRKEGYDDVFAAYVGSTGDEPGVVEEVEALMDEYDLRSHIHMPGRQDQEQLRLWYNAADVFCLASEKEGWANVLLESLACGTPVVGTNVWGTPEVINSPDVGILVERTAEDIERGLGEALDQPWDRDAIVAYARTHTWQATAERVVRQFEEVLRARGRRARAAAGANA